MQMTLNQKFYSSFILFKKDASLMIQSRDQAPLKSFLKMKPSLHPVKHQFSSSIVSWIEDEDSMVDISHFTDSEVSEDGYSHSNSYLSRNLHDMHIVSTPILPFSDYVSLHEMTVRYWYCFGPFWFVTCQLVSMIIFIFSFYSFIVA